MDLPLGPREREFRDELQQWLDRLSVPEGLYDWGAGPDLKHLPIGKQWQRLLFDGGWAGLTWPTSYGGRGANVVEQAVYAETVASAGLPRQINLVGPGIVGPSLIAHGTRQQQDRHLQPILRGDEIWCQLFSEPGAGSDLAGLTTRAERRDGGWIVNGQKVWSSGAHFADFGLLLAVTEKDAPRHRRLTAFLVDMRSPGIEARPIRQMDDRAKFNEVFISDVELDASQILGQPGQGWEIAMSALGLERSIHGTRTMEIRHQLDELRPLVAELAGADAVLFRHRWVSAWARVESIHATWIRVLADEAALGGALMPMLKLSTTELLRDVSVLASDVLGSGMWRGPEHAAWRARYLAAPSHTISSGTSEIMRNIISERHLGLPRT